MTKSWHNQSANKTDEHNKNTASTTETLQASIDKTRPDGKQVSSRLRKTVVLSQACNIDSPSSSQLEVIREESTNPQDKPLLPSPLPTKEDNDSEILRGSNGRDSLKETGNADSDDDLPCSGHVSQPNDGRKEDESDNNLSSSLHQIGCGFLDGGEEDANDRNFPLSGHASKDSPHQKHDTEVKLVESKEDHEDQAKTSNVIKEDSRELQSQRKQPGRKAKTKLQTRKGKKGRSTSNSTSGINSKPSVRSIPDEKTALNSGRSLQDSEKKDDEDEVSSLIGDEEEFFLHKPRPWR